MDINPDIAFAMGFLKPSTLVSRFLTWALEFSLRHSDNIVVLDQCMKNKAIEHGSDPDAIRIIPPWPVHQFELNAHGYPKENAFRRENGLCGKFVILYSGNQSKAHPLDLALQAALKLRDNEKIAFVFVGNGALVADVGNFKHEHGLSNIIQLAHQPRERLHESLTFPDMHLVVMGNAVNGLVHPSKISRHARHRTALCFHRSEKKLCHRPLEGMPYGFQVEHGELDRFSRG